MPESSEVLPSRVGRWTGRLRRVQPTTVLIVVMAAYFAESLFLSILRLLEFATSNWDLGIFQQALWTTGHGHLLYESGDWETNGTASFLQIHPALILLALVPLYVAIPSPLTLLAVQSAIVAAAAVPLYALGVRVLGSPWKSIAVAGLYLAYTPILTSNMFDFHLESFIPLEIFLFFLFWYEGRYYWGTVVAVVAFVTIEVMPFLIGIIAFFFLLETISPTLRRAGDPPREPSPGPRPTVWQRLPFALRTRGARWSLALVIGSGVAYVLLRLFEWFLLPALIGTPPEPPVGSSGIGALASSASFGFTFKFAAHLSTKLGYWFVLLGLLAFLPLLTPRLLLLSVPWFFFTLQSSRSVWSTIGFQYGFIAAAPLMVAVPFGVVAFDERVRPWLRRHLRRSPNPDGTARSRRWRLRRPSERQALALAFAGLLFVNLALTPGDPLEQHLRGALASYTVSYNATPGFWQVTTMASYIPVGATILASSDLFPLVANDAHAYSLLWTLSQPAYLPFNASLPPTWVFFDSAQEFAIPQWLWPLLANLSLYGLYMATWNSPVGSVYLFELGYSGPGQYLCTSPSGPIWLAEGSAGATTFGAYGLPSPPSNC